MEALIILLIWIYTSFVSFIIGFGFLSFVYIKSDKVGTSLPHFSIIILFGLIVINVIASYVSLFYRIGWEINLFFTLLSLLILLKHWIKFTQVLKAYQLDLKTYPILLKFLFAPILIVIALYCSSSQSSIYDDALYYIQTIKWINSYSVIPGLGNLHGRLAFNSNWHLLSSVFNLHFIFNKSYSDLNGLLFIIISCLSITSINKLLNNNNSIVDYICACFLLPSYLYIQNLTAPTADLPAVYFIWLSLILFIQFVESNDKKLIFLISIISCYTITIKASCLVIFILCIYFYIVSILKKDRTFYMMFIINIVIFLPWVLRNIILSGYLLYPFYQIDIFSFDWKIPLQFAIREAYTIKGWARIPSENCWKYATVPFSDWIMPWFKRMKLTHLSIFLFVLVFTIYKAALLVKELLTKKVITKVLPTYYFLYFILYTGIIFWFYQAPNFRFGYGFLLFFCFLSISLMLEKNNTKWVKSAFIILVFCSPILMVMQIVPKKEMNKKIAHYPVKKINKKFPIFVPILTEQCGDSPLPCVNKLDTRLILRGNRIESGFKLNVQ